MHMICKPGRIMGLKNLGWS